MLRFRRKQLESMLSENRILILDTKAYVLSLVEHNRIVEQEVLYSKIPDRPRGASFVELLLSSYPGVLTYTQLIEWHNQDAFVTFRRTHPLWAKKRDWLTKAIRGHISEMRERLEPFGVGIANRFQVGYELKPLGFSPVRNPDRFEDISLPDGALEDDFTLTIDHEKKVLSLLRGTAIVEQAIIYPTVYQFFMLLVRGGKQGCRYRELVMTHFDVSATQADAWLARAVTDSTSHREMMEQIRLKIKKLRRILKPFGIGVENMLKFGYVLSHTARQDRMPRKKGSHHGTTAI